MAEGLRESFVNPYVDESSNEARFSTVVTMDEAHERWMKGQWRANKSDFSLDEDFLSEKKAPEIQPPVKNRFEFDLKRDIIDGDTASSSLEDISYSPSYRPQGSIGCNISNITIDRLRYNTLADIREELPEDLSYLYGGSSDRRTRKETKLIGVRSHDRLSTPVDKRRAEVDKMLPERSNETPEMIMADIKRRREIEDAKSGIVRTAHKRKYSLGIYDTTPEPGTVAEFYGEPERFVQENITERGSWRGDIPVQDGLVPDSKSQPYFGRFSRTWSAMDSLSPSRSEILRHTVNTIYDDDAEEGGRRFRSNREDRGEYYVSDMDFDPEDRYRPLSRGRKEINASQNALSDSIMSGEFNNPYVYISNDRLRSIINHDMRGPGNLSEPEGLTDPSLLYEWNMGYSRVNTDENKYAKWMKTQSELAENAEQSRYRGSHHTGRPGAYMQREKPYGEDRRYPRGNYREKEIRRRDMEEQLRRATEQGISDGREIVRRQKAEQKKRMQDYYKSQQQQIAKQQQEYYKRQQEYYKQQAKMYAQAQSNANRRGAQSAKMPKNGAVRPNVPNPAGRAPQYGQVGRYPNTPYQQQGAAQGRQNAAGARPAAQNPAGRMPQYGQAGYYPYTPYPKQNVARPNGTVPANRAGRSGNPQK